MKTSTFCIYLFVVASLFLSLVPQTLSATTVIKNVPAGQLNDLLGSQRDTITNLVLIGEINGTDIGVIRNLPNLTSIDLENVSIVAGGSFMVDTFTMQVKPNILPRRMFYMKSLLTSIILPSNLTAISDLALYSCSGLTSIRIPDNVVSIDNYAFHSCNELTSVFIGKSVSNFGLAVFCCCSKIKNYTVAESNAQFCSVDGVVFSKNRKNLYIYPNERSGSYIIPNTVTTIKGHAFCERYGLTSITIPESIEIIETFAFQDCSNLLEIHCKSLTPPALIYDSLDKIDKKSCVLYVPMGAFKTYSNAPIWGDFNSIIEEGSVSISKLNATNKTVYTENNSIVICNSSRHETIFVYSIEGVLIQKVTATMGETRINVPKNAIYLVKIAGKVLKVSL